MSNGMRAALLPRAALLALAALVAIPVSALGNEAHDWLRRMNTAVADSNYDGWFDHRVGEHSERLRIVHRKQGGVMSERVITTDGSGRELVRNGPEYVEYFPERRVSVRETRNRSYGYFVALNGLNDDSGSYYNITMGGTERLINRNVQLIRVEPKDNLRYGYRFWLDQRSALPLKTQIVSRTGEVLEEFSFVRLTTPQSISDDLLKPDIDTTGFKPMRRDTPTHNPEVKATFRARDAQLPAGFRVRIFTAPEEEARATGPRTRFIVSDGIAWVSVFVENADKDARPAAPAAGGRADGVMVFGGSLVAYVARPRGYKVTAVGEVPPATIRVIAEAFQPE